MKEVSPEILRLIERTADSKEFRRWMRDLLLTLLEIDGTPHSDPAITAQNERKAFHVIETEIGGIIGGAVPRFIPIDPAIERHPFYTPPHYTKTAERPMGFGVWETYFGRGNLVLALPGVRPRKAGQSLAINSHIDTVAPHIPPRVSGDTVFGRGACDAKGQVVTMLAQMRLLAEARRRLGVTHQSDLQYLFVIEEEPGGNGSLSLAIQDPRPYDVLLVGEITDLKVHPANRGAVWYKTEIACGKAGRLNAVEMGAFIVLALEEEGARIKGESAHPLFPTRPVQTNHGIIGPYGSHPSAVRHLVRLWIGAGKEKGSGTFCANTFCAKHPSGLSGKRCLTPFPPFVRGSVEKAVAAYCARYGDKTKEADPATVKMKVDHHYDLIPVKAKKGLVLAVHGKAGHMGAVLECDGAITKTAYIVRELMNLPGVACSMAHPEKDEPWTSAKRVLSELVLEGGQGFVPTHDIFEVQRRLVQAAVAGAKEYCRRVGATYQPTMVKTTFDKLHNDSFARRPDTPAMKAAIYACKKAGVWKEEPIVGWNVSCDARIFAKQFPQRDVITFGPGSLAHAHSPQEQISISDMAAAAKTMAIFALALCGWQKE